MKKHFYPSSAESMTVLTFRQMALTVLAFTLLFIAAVVIAFRAPEDQPKHQSVILGK